MEGWWDDLARKDACLPPSPTAGVWFLGSTPASCPLTYIHTCTQNKWRQCIKHFRKMPDVYFWPPYTWGACIYTHKHTLEHTRAPDSSPQWLWNLLSWQTSTELKETTVRLFTVIFQLQERCSYPVPLLAQVHDVWETFCGIYPCPWLHLPSANSNF